MNVLTQKLVSGGNIDISKLKFFLAGENHIFLAESKTSFWNQLGARQGIFSSEGCRSAIGRCETWMATSPSYSRPRTASGAIFEHLFVSKRRVHLFTVTISHSGTGKAFPGSADPWYEVHLLTTFCRFAPENQRASLADAAPRQPLLLSLLSLFLKWTPLLDSPTRGYLVGHSKISALVKALNTSSSSVGGGHGNWVESSKQFRRRRSDPFTDY